MIALLSAPPKAPKIKNANENIMEKSRFRIISIISPLEKLLKLIINKINPLTI